MNTLLLDALACKEVKRAPVWLMRQAGRYLPSYRKLRQEHSLWNLFHDPELAAHITLLPLQIMPLDAAIVFSDLLVIAEVWDKKVIYPEKGSPRIEPRCEAINELYLPSPKEIQEKLSYVFDTIRFLKPSLSVPLLGFCGAPFTLLCYLLQEGGKSSFTNIRFWLQHKKDEVLSALNTICETCILYMLEQVRAGVDAVQIFDSWADLLDKEEFLTYCLPFWKRMKTALESTSIPLIFFSRNASFYLEEISSFSPNAISCEEGLSLEALRKKIPPHIALQGNISPTILAEASCDEIEKVVIEMLSPVQGQRGIICNLGHGVLPNTPVENVLRLVETVHRYG